MTYIDWLLTELDLFSEGLLINGQSDIQLIVKAHGVYLVSGYIDKFADSVGGCSTTIKLRPSRAL